MKILLTGGGSGGHVTPLLAVAKSLKKIDSRISLVAITENNNKFVDLLKNDQNFDHVYTISAGKYRRYGGLSRLEKLRDVATHARNVRDVARVCRGYVEARRLLKIVKPDKILIKGGFVGVPVGLAAAGLKIPFITHDSDSIPGMANRIVSRWASLHATGMPVEFYNYPKEKTVYTGVPIANMYQMVDKDLEHKYRQEIGVSNKVQTLIGVIGGSQGGEQLNKDMLSISARLMQHYPALGILHIAGENKAKQVEHGYKQELMADEQEKVIVKGFVNDAYRYTGACDIVISRASATVVAELAVQAKAVILVPGQLADDHQRHNARLLAKAGRVLSVDHGDREGLFNAINELIVNKARATELAQSLAELARPAAADELAALLVGSGQDV